MSKMKYDFPEIDWRNGMLGLHERTDICDKGYPCRRATPQEIFCPGAVVLDHTGEQHIILEVDTSKGGLIRFRTHNKEEGKRGLFQWMSSDGMRRIGTITMPEEGGCGDGRDSRKAGKMNGEYKELKSVVFPGEEEAVRMAVQIGEAYGYGNIIAHLATAWAVILRDKHGLSEEDAIAAVSNCTPYPLPPKEGRAK
jgi:hypothetical protein